MKEDFIKKVQIREANSSIGVSTLRGQKKGTTQIVRSFLKEFNLHVFKEVNLESQFVEILDKQTDLLKELINSRSWGIARKALNIFLFHSVNNIYLNKEYNLNKIIPFLELTLDNPNVKKHLKKFATEENTKLDWTNITKLTKVQSDKIQAFAKRVAKERFDCKRCYLDLYFWRDGE